MQITVRAETTADYYRIAEINTLAFSAYVKSPAERSYISEMALVDMLRHYAAFDPQLSLVAECEGQVVGHILFTPYQLWVGGQPQKAVSLAPVAVDPQVQKTGIGAALIQAGHTLAKDKGFDFSFLLGHPSYYPRFGYQMRMFGESYLCVNAADIPAGEVSLLAREVRREDVGALCDLWHLWFDDIDLALFPGNTLLDWVSHGDQYISNVLINDGRMEGYVRYNRDDPFDIKLILTSDEEALIQILRILRQRQPSAEKDEIRLPLHASSAMLNREIKIPYTVHNNPWNAAMICLLNEENRVVRDYIEQVKAGTRSPGLLVYPPMIEFV